MTLDEQIAILQAMKNGKQIECRPITSLLDEWFTWALYQFDFTNYDYRIKKEPRSWELVKFQEVIE